MRKETKSFKLPFVDQYTDEFENPKRSFASPLNTKLIMSDKIFINRWRGIFVYRVEISKVDIVLGFHLALILFIISVAIRIKKTFPININLYWKVLLLEVWYCKP